MLDDTETGIVRMALDALMEGVRLDLKNTNRS